MGSGASLEKASPEEVREVVHSLQKDHLATLRRAMSLLEKEPKGLQQMRSLAPCSGFQSVPVPRKVVSRLLEGLASVPSSANTQPWTVAVVQGQKRDLLAERFLQNHDAGKEGTALFEDLPKNMPERMAKQVRAYEESLTGQRKGCEFWGAPLHLALCAPVGPCLTEDPPVDGVFLDLGSALMALLFGAKDLGLGARVHFSAKLNATYREVLALEEDLFVVCGLSLGWPEAPTEIPAPTAAEITWCCDDRAFAAAPAPAPASPGEERGLLELVASRHCSHSLSDAPVPRCLVESVLQAANHVPSHSNSQPWAVTVIQGEARDRLSEAMLAHFDAGNDGGQSYKKYSTQNTERMQRGKDTYGEELYERLHGLNRDDKDGRRRVYRRNYEFWGAPILLLLRLPKAAVAGTFVDVGSYMFGVLVAMHSLGLGGKPLGSVAKFTELCRSVLGGHVVPEDEHLVCGICIGWPSDGRDPREKPDWFPSRLALDETTCWLADADWD
ncbi:unnamed protein product [Effrenium voratum]|uniref:Nitroreductase domain-containing protein n=1 Tax=Effrenium voratum TaxID=2562239 RepID=A0AA36I303_9DINO|nr:unnamed protein product [Effrenium voratum]CAJ1448094.1 unnamed protein product [Effrenium voratum]